MIEEETYSCSLFSLLAVRKDGFGYIKLLLVWVESFIILFKAAILVLFSSLLVLKSKILVLELLLAELITSSPLLVDLHLYWFCTIYALLLISISFAFTSS